MTHTAIALILAVVAIQCLHIFSLPIRVDNTDVDVASDGTTVSIDDLNTLLKIREMGAISEDEYEARRLELVDRLTGTGKYRTRSTTTALGGPPGGRNYTVYTKTIQWLLNNVKNGMPRSYIDVVPVTPPQNYWTTSIYLDVGAFAPDGQRLSLDSQIAIQERTLTRYGLNLYDGATWQIALNLANITEVPEVYERNILYPSSSGANPLLGGIIDLRADKEDFKYGAKKVAGTALQKVCLPGNTSRVPQMPDGNPAKTSVKNINGAYFYRMIGPSYSMNDPLDGNYAQSWVYPWPNNDTTTPWNIFGEIHWNDWKPITGENVWGAIIGPLQGLVIRNGTNITDFKTYKEAPASVQLALSIMPAIVALQSPLGSLYHGPKGMKMFPPDPSEETNVSNENNFSAYASLVMLYQILVNKSADATDSFITQAKTDLQSLICGLEKWFSKYLLSDPYLNHQVIYQGGHVSFGGDFEPAKINNTGGFAVDCQTWGLTVVGVDRMDTWYGAGTSYQVWQATKKFAGYYTADGKLGGVGYTIEPSVKQNLIWSAEWSWGAVSMCKQAAKAYRKLGNTQYAQEFEQDAQEMETELRKPVVRCDSLAWCGGGLMQEDGSYLYANDRFFIPWGWYANAIGSLASTSWSVFLDNDFNPFVLGGGDESLFPSPPNMCSK